MIEVYLSFSYYLLLLTQVATKIIFTIKENIDGNFLEEQTVSVYEDWSIYHK
jgi:hypothetical protein